MQQQQGTPPMLTQMQAQLPPAANISTEVIQKYLDENKQLILAIMDNQNLGKLAECAQYQARLQNNLMYLAAIADAQPHIAAASRPQIPVQHGIQYVQAPPNFLPIGSQQFQEQVPQHHMNHPQIQPNQGYIGMPTVSNGVHRMHSEGGLGSSGVGSSVPPTSNPHEFAQGMGSSFDVRGNASLLETASLEGHRNSTIEQKAGDVENN